MEKPEDVVAEQAEDPGLWFVSESITEAYLQAALRRLHAAVEQRSQVQAALDALNIRRSTAPEGECKYCDAFRAAGDRFHPHHDPSPNCESSGRPHCTCDTCF